MVSGLQIVVVCSSCAGPMDKENPSPYTAKFKAGDENRFVYKRLYCFQNASLDILTVTPTDSRPVNCPVT